QVDAFVVLDNVQFVQRSWHSRNRVKTADGVKWLTVPVEHASRAEIRAIRVHREIPWRREHFETLRHSYARAAHWTGLEPILRAAYEADDERLQDVNERFIRHLAALLDVDLGASGRAGKLVRASDLDVRGRKGDLLVDICRALGATEYLSAPGSAAYLSEDD